MSLAKHMSVEHLELMSEEEFRQIAEAFRAVELKRGMSLDSFPVRGIANKSMATETVPTVTAPVVNLVTCITCKKTMDTDTIECWECRHCVDD